METNLQKHLSAVLDNRLSFEDHLKMILNKVNKTIWLLRKLQNILQRSALLTIYKTFIRPHVDYGDIMYDRSYNAPFHQKLELLQYNACLAIIGAIRGTLKEKLYKELALKSLQLRRWLQKTILFLHTIQQWTSSSCLQTNPFEKLCIICNNIPFFKTRPTFLKNFLSFNYHWME